MSAEPARDAYIASPIPIEGYLRELFPKLDAQIIFDIGSCEGEDAIRYSSLFPDATIYAFEPVPDNIALLHSNIERRSKTNIRVHELALSDQAGSAILHVSSGHPPGTPASDWDYGNKSSSLLLPDQHLEVHPWVTFDRTIEVKTDTIARILESEGLDRIDFVHLDVQGAELMVLAGAGPFLERIGAVWMEVEAIPLYRGQPLKRDVQRFMAAHGFRRMASTVGAVSGDELYFNPRLLRPRRERSGRLSWARARNAAMGLLKNSPLQRRIVRAMRTVADRLRRPMHKRRETDRE
jgi:FkbM family methyltransferase